MQRAQPDDGARYAGLRSDPLIRKPRVGGRHQRSIHAATPLIPMITDQNPCAQSLSPMDMIVQGCAMSLFQASQQWSRMFV